MAAPLAAVERDALSIFAVAPDWMPGATAQVKPPPTPLNMDIGMGIPVMLFPPDRLNLPDPTYNAEAARVVAVIGVVAAAHISMRV